MAEYFADQIHHVPGRLRLKLSALKRNEAGALFAQERLYALDGVRSVSGNALTGSVVVRFDPQITSVSQILDELKAHGLLDAPALTPAPVGSAAAQSLGAIVQPQRARSLADAFVDKTIEALLERCAIALVAALI